MRLQVTIALIHPPDMSMAAEETASPFPVAQIAAELLAQSEVAQRARVVANWLIELLPGMAAVVYVILDQENPTWTAMTTAGEITVGEVVDFSTGTLGTVAESRSIQAFEAAHLQREDFSHLDIRHTEFSLGYAPLLANDLLVGAIELVSYEPSFPTEALQLLQDMAELASPAIASALNYEGERNNSLQSISRVAQMYDLEKVFNSTLEMEELLEMIAKKFAEVMNVQAINLWMVSGDGVELVNQAGSDATAPLGSVQKAGEGIAGDVSDNGEPVLIEDPADERLGKRNGGYEDGAVFSVLAAPLMDRENLVGVVEAINRLDGMPFDEDDEFLLSTISETANNALHNADLLQAERKVEVLEALVKVSGEITSTLDLDRVLQAVVNEPASVIPYERAAIALEQRGKLQMRAITGQPRINPQDPDVVRLQALLQWASLSNAPMLVAQRGDEIEVDREESRAKFQAYFAETGMRGFHSMPLADDDGRVGILSYESSDPDFLSVAHLEMIKVLSGQATVALRNASLYREVPFIDLLEPILARKKKFLAMERGRRALMVVGIFAALIFLAFFPLPLRVDGPAIVAPAHTAPVQPEVAGVIQKVDVREGDQVQQGTVLANLDDWQYRSELAAAQAKYETAISQMDRALATDDGAEAGRLRAQADLGSAQVGRARERLDKTFLRSPIAGRVATPHIEDMAGRSLNPGDTFAEIVDTSHAAIDISIDDVDAGLLRTGEAVSVKLEGLPSRTFHGTITIVSPKGELEGDQRMFYARMLVANDDGMIRAGMQGRGKIMTGWRPAGWVIFRRPMLWLWAKLWSWFGW
jgi:RND family efflux transporter MFP subunit